MNKAAAEKTLGNLIHLSSIWVCSAEREDTYADEDFRRGTARWASSGGNTGLPILYNAFQENQGVAVETARTGNVRCAGDCGLNTAGSFVELSVKVWNG